MLTPNEVSSQRFDTAMRGYSKAQIDEFFTRLMADYATLYKDNALLKSKLKTLVTTVEQYRSVDENMRKALLNTQQMSEKMLEEARVEAKRIIDDAEQAAQAKVGDLGDRITREEKRLDNVKAETVVFVNAIRDLFYHQIQQLEAVPTKVDSEEPIPREKLDARLKETAKEIGDKMSTQFGDSPIKDTMSFGFVHSDGQPLAADTAMLPDAAKLSAAAAEAAKAAPVVPDVVKPVGAAAEAAAEEAAATRRIVSVIRSQPDDAAAKDVVKDAVAEKVSAAVKPELPVFMPGFGAKAATVAETLPTDKVAGKPLPELSYETLPEFKPEPVVPVSQPDVKSDLLGGFKSGAKNAVSEAVAAPAAAVVPESKPELVAPAVAAEPVAQDKTTDESFTPTLSIFDEVVNSSRKPRMTEPASKLPEVGAVVDDVAAKVETPLPVAAEKVADVVAEAKPELPKVDQPVVKEVVAAVSPKAAPDSLPNDDDTDMKIATPIDKPRGNMMQDALDRLREMDKALGGADKPADRDNGGVDAILQRLLRGGERAMEDGREDTANPMPKIDYDALSFGKNYDPTANK